MGQLALKGTVQPQAGHDGQCQADIVDDVEPEMAEVGLAADEAVDALRLEDGSEDGDEGLYSGVLEDEHPPLSVPLQTVDRLLFDLWLWAVVSTPAPGPSPATATAVLLLLLRHLEGGEEDLAVLVRGRHELAHEEEEVAQGDGLDEVDPGVDVHVGVGKRHLEEAANGEDGEVAADPQDVELLVGPGQVGCVPEHEDEEAEQGEASTGAGDDLVDREEVIAAGQFGSLGVGQWPGHGAHMAVLACVVVRFVVVVGASPCHQLRQAGDHALVEL